jgi:hypothetical protein
LSPRPVVPLSPVRVAICESLLAMVRRRGSGAVRKSMKQKD